MVSIPGKTAPGSLLRIPCNLVFASSDRIGGAVAEGTPARPWVFEPAPQPGRPSVCPSTSNSRLGRKSPFAQGRGKMEMSNVGIDVSKDRLDVHILPEGEASQNARRYRRSQKTPHHPQRHPTRQTTMAKPNRL